MTNTTIRRLSTVAVIAAVVLAATGGIAAAQSGSLDAQGSPDVEVYVPNDEVTPGTETTFTVQLDNDGELTQGNEADREYVTTARSVVTTLDAGDAPVTVKTGAKSIGQLEESEPKDVGFDIEVPDGAEPGTYEMELDIDYTYTSKVRDAPSLRATSTTQTKSIERDIEIEISDDARFRVTDVESTLRVNEEGEITGEITNVGGEDATNVEVEFPSENPNIDPLETSVAVGDIEAGDAASFEIPIEVGSQAEAVPKRFDLPVSFRNENGVRTTDDDPELLAEIGPERDAFIIESNTRTIAGGSSSVMEFTVTNNRDETLTDIEPKLFTDTPFSSSNDEAFIESLDPGESANISFDMSADSGATTKTYPVTIDLRYEDSEGESRITDSYRAAVDVTEPEDSGGLGSLGTVVIGLIAVLAVGGGYVWYRGQ